MTLKGGTAQACAACKHQRRKCTSECILAPYFPADQPKVFLNVHKLFGVSNIVKILKILDPTQKKIAMDSIIIQANYRDKYPVHGCWEEICRLQYQIWLAQQHLHAVYQQLQLCRQQQQQQNTPSIIDQLELGLQHSYSNSNSVLYLDSNDNNPLWVEYPFENNNTPLLSSHLHHYDHHIPPIFDSVDDSQSYIYSKDPYESSSEESLKDIGKCSEHVSENELKNAAACFSLTTVN